MRKALGAGVAVAALLVSACSDGADSPMAAATPAATDGATTGSTGSGSSEVAIKDFLFAPTPVRVSPGTTITWTNADSAVHSVVSAEKGLFGSESMDQDATFSFTPEQAGTIDYICGIHNYMTGQIVVG